MSSGACDNDQNLPVPRHDRQLDPQRSDVTFDITVVTGDEGRKLATAQAQALLDVLLWLCDHTPTP